MQGPKVMKHFCEICHYSDISEIRKRLKELTGECSGEKLVSSQIRKDKYLKKRYFKKIKV